MKLETENSHSATSEGKPTNTKSPIKRGITLISSISIKPDKTKKEDKDPADLINIVTKKSKRKIAMKGS